MAALHRGMSCRGLASKSRFCRLELATVGGRACLEQCGSENRELSAARTHLCSADVSSPSAASAARALHSYGRFPWWGQAHGQKKNHRRDRLHETAPDDTGVPTPSVCFHPSSASH